MRLSKALCSVVGEVIGGTGSHGTLDTLFLTSGAPGEPPALAHHAKWKEWLFRAGQDPNVNSLTVLGNVLEEFMDLPPRADASQYTEWQKNRQRVEAVLEENGLRYFRFGRLLPQGSTPHGDLPELSVSLTGPSKPQAVEELLEIIVRGLRRAMHPLTHRRKGAQPLAFGSEHDVQDLLHSLLRPWIADIRPEEFTPSYAGSSTRMDFLLPAYKLVIETKIVRDRSHAKSVGDELIIDIDHYSKHPDCERLWCVVYDPNQFITNAEGLKVDLEGTRSAKGKHRDIKLFIV